VRIKFQWKTQRLSHVNFLIKLSVEESGDNVHLVDCEAVVSSEGEHDSEQGEFDDRGEGFFVIDAVNLCESVCDQSSFEALKLVSLVRLHAKHPF
jgi:hypothetical protein